MEADRLERGSREILAAPAHRVSALYAVPAGLLIAAAAVPPMLRLSDRRRDQRAVRQLSSGAPKGARFSPDMVEDLPGPARRYFLFAISPGTPIQTTVEIELAGEIALGTKEHPRYMAMQARQVLSPLRGFVWRPRVASGLVRITGSDGYIDGDGWTVFWLLGIVPIARAGGGADYARSAAGRAIAEGLFWAPAALLPSHFVRWEPISSNTARLCVRHRGEEFLVDLTVADDGRPLSVVFQRWSRENRERVWRSQPFGGTVEEVRRFGGYTVASRIEGGNFFGTPDYFPFYRARVTNLRFL